MSKEIARNSYLEEAALSMADVSKLIMQKVPRKTPKATEFKRTPRMNVGARLVKDGGEQECFIDTCVLFAGHIRHKSLVPLGFCGCHRATCKGLERLGETGLWEANSDLHRRRVLMNPPAPSHLILCFSRGADDDLCANGCHLNLSTFPNLLQL